jgi:hypothetical protein
MSFRKLVGKAAASGVYCGKQQNNPVEGVPGFGVHDAFKHKVANEHGGNHVQQHPIKKVGTLKLQREVFGYKNTNLFQHMWPQRYVLLGNAL